MDQITPNQGDQGDDPIAGALAQVKTWKESGETDKAIAGCKEILEAAPDNTEAKQLLEELGAAEGGAPQAQEEAPKQEEEVKVEETTTETPAVEPATEETPTETPAETPAPEAPAPEAAPETELKVEPTEPVAEEPAPEEKPAEEGEFKLETPAPETTEATTEEEKPAEKAKEEESPLYKLGGEAEAESETALPADSPLGAPGPATGGKKFLNKKLLFIIGSVILVIVIGFVAYSFLTGGDEAPAEETVVEEEVVVTEPVEEELMDAAEETTEEEVTEEEDPLEARNDQRFIDLAMLEEALDTYYEENHVYPSPNELTTELGIELPLDPMHGETSEAGETFGYVYAIYDNYLGSNQEYILSGIFENEEGETNVWATGALTEDHPDYRDTSLDNVSMLGEVVEEVEAEAPAEEEEEEEKVKVKR